MNDYVDPSTVPAKLIQQHVTDPADNIPGAPANLGQPVLPHIFTVAGRYGIAARSYSQGDEALMHSPANAEVMRNEPMIMECLESRMRSTALLNWHVEPLDPEELSSEQLDKIQDTTGRKLSRNKWSAKEISDKMNVILRHTPRFTSLRYSLMEGIWYGRYGTSHQTGVRKIQGKFRTYLKRWEPRHGDKFLFRYDDNSGEYDPDQIGIRVGPGYDTQKTYKDYRGIIRKKVEATQFGLAYWFDDKERKLLGLHKHIVEDGDFDTPIKAGNIHGVGIRSRIYWTWFAYQECLKFLLEYLERTALGIEIWPYPAHNPQAEERAREAAARRGSPGHSVMLVPVPEGENADLYQPRVIEPGMGGVGELKDVLHMFFGHKIKRFIMGQTLTSESEGGGLGGSGVADAHLATLADIIRFDATNLEETLTTDLVAPFQGWNFPGSEEHYLRYVINTEEPNADKIMEGYARGWEMGLAIKSEDVYSVLGASKPSDDDDVLKNPAMQPGAMQQGMPAPMGAPNGSVHGPFPGNPLGEKSNLPKLHDTPDSDDRERNEAVEDNHDWYSTDKNSAITDLNNLDVSVPSDKQAKAGNYSKGHIRIHGLPITIETKKGQERKGKNWSRTMTCHYGYVKGTVGRDKDHVDVFIGNQPHSEIVFVIDQVTKGGKFDEHKCVLGCTNQTQATRLYLSNYPTGWKCGPVTSMTVDQFKNWLAEGDTTSRVVSQVSKYSAKWDESKHRRDTNGKFSKMPHMNVTREELENKSTDELLEMGRQMMDFSEQRGTSFTREEEGINALITTVWWHKNRKEEKDASKIDHHQIAEDRPASEFKIAEDKKLQPWFQAWLDATGTKRSDVKSNSEYIAWMSKQHAEFKEKNPDAYGNSGLLNEHRDSFTEFLREKAKLKQAGLFGEDFEPGQFSPEELAELRGEKTKDKPPPETQHKMFDYMDDDPDQTTLFSANELPERYGSAFDQFILSYAPEHA